MKTIEERAEEYVNTYYHDNFYPQSLSEAEYDVKSAFIAGANAEHKELTRWHNPKIELPQNGKTVLIRLKSLPYYAVGCYTPNSRQVYEWQTADRIIPNSIVIGWREIHE